MQVLQNISFSVMILTFLSGCGISPMQNSPQSYVSAQRVVEKTEVIHKKNLSSNYHLRYGNDPALERVFNKYVQTGAAANIVTDGFVKFAYNALQQPIIKTTPFQETVISLEDGEKFTNVSSGDPSRWSYAAAVSGAGKNQQQHILIKPSQSDLSTNLVITTDRRIYNLRLLSNANNQTTRSVSFWYPDDMIRAINNETVQNEEKQELAIDSKVNLNQLNFNYSISSPWIASDPIWKPTRVFDDLTHTYIQFSDRVSNHDLPVLFVKDGSKQELVNYRYKEPYFVVDKIFKQAVLMMGAGSDQIKITINNNSYR